jgi:DNA sulfur modification protein DndB
MGEHVGEVVIHGMMGPSAQKEVFLGFAPAALLHALSFADVLDEDTKRGYQRRLNAAHSADFRRYIQFPESATIPLTFNLRKREDEAWKLHRDGADGAARLVLALDRGKLLTQVDCQHRLGHLQDVGVVLPIMCFLNLSEREEMEIFNVINSKAKGLCSSLLDFHDATLAKDLASERPELFIALLLNDIEDSPWYQQLKLGGKTTSGLKRRASLRTMQKAIKSFLNQTRALKKHPADTVGRMVIDFWSVLSVLLREQWGPHQRNLLCKGVGVNALMGIAGDLVNEAGDQACDKAYFRNRLADFVLDFDWTNRGPLGGFGGGSGVKAALEILRQARGKHQLRQVS